MQVVSKRDITTAFTHLSITTRVSFSSLSSRALSSDETVICTTDRPDSDSFTKLSDRFRFPRLVGEVPISVRGGGLRTPFGVDISRSYALVRSSSGSRECDAIFSPNPCQGQFDSLTLPLLQAKPTNQKGCRLPGAQRNSTVYLINNILLSRVVTSRCCWQRSVYSTFGSLGVWLVVRYQELSDLSTPPRRSEREDARDRPRHQNNFERRHGRDYHIPRPDSVIYDDI